MAKDDGSGRNDSRPSRRPATTPEGRESQLTAAAMHLAEEQILNGTASSQIIVHFLKAGSGREKLERQRIEFENELLRVKKEAIEGQQRVEELYKDALNAMRTYSGQDAGTFDD